MEALGRVELPTNGLGNRCSIHLSYRATCRKRRDCFSLPQQWLVKRSNLLPNSRNNVLQLRHSFRFLMLPLFLSEFRHLIKSQVEFIDMVNSTFVAPAQ